MHAVVIDRVAGDPAAVLGRVAAALGVTAYDVRASLTVPGGGPAILAVHADVEPAEATARALVGIGVDARVVEVGSTTASIGDFTARRFEFGADALELDTRDGRTASVPWASIDVVVRAISVVTTEHSEVVRERSFSPGRSLLSGGLINTRTRETTQRTTQTDSEEILYVFTGGPEAIAMRESSLVFQGLGDAIQPARTANFGVLVAELHRRCPRAIFDERLRKRAQQGQILGRVLSPDEHLDLAVALVAWSVRRGPR